MDIYGRIGYSRIILRPDTLPDRLKDEYIVVATIPCAGDKDTDKVECIAQYVKSSMPHDPPSKKTYEILMTKTCNRVDLKIRRLTALLPGEEEVGKVKDYNQELRYLVVWELLLR